MILRVENIPLLYSVLCEDLRSVLAAEIFDSIREVPGAVLGLGV